jgi:hypothetical protein
MKHAHHFIFTLLFWFIAIHVKADTTRPLPPPEWDAETQLWLARAMVSEADWSTVDHAAIAWTLKRQWRARVEHQPAWSFIDQIRRYCAGLRHQTPRTNRHRWVRELGFHGDAPASWPKSSSWDAYRSRWLRVLRFAGDWGAGRVGDPCRGKAIHWGGGMDIPMDKTVRPVNCGFTHNIFYGHR